MKVRCIDDKNGEYWSIEVGANYEVVKIEGNFYYLDNGLMFSKSRFEIVEEDKMDKVEIKVGDKVEVENPIFGCIKFEVLKVLTCLDTGERYLIPKDNTPISYIKEKDVKLVPKRTVEEVLEEMKKESLNPYHDYGYKLCEVVFGGTVYEVNYNLGLITLGAYMFSYEVANKYADELNEIIGADTK